jgi:hypothetical protein
VSVVTSKTTRTASRRIATSPSWTSSWRIVKDFVPIRVTQLRTHTCSPTR